MWCMKRLRSDPLANGGDLELCLVMIAKSLRQARKFAGIQSKYVAERIGLTERQFRDIEHGRSHPSVKILRQIAGAIREEMDARQDASGALRLPWLRWGASAETAGSHRPN